MTPELQNFLGATAFVLAIGVSAALVIAACAWKAKIENSKEDES